MKILERASALWNAARKRFASPDSSTWRLADAVVYSSRAGYREEVIGVEIWYDYHAEGEHWSGSCRIDFADDESAQAYAAARPPGSTIRIRYCPGDVGRS